MKKVFFIFFYFIVFAVLSQNSASNWYFGSYSGLDFRNGPPMILKDGEINTIEGCSTISDDDGNLLFYTNGVKVWNKKHEIMENGDELLGHWSSTNSSIVIPKPNSTSIYYLITVDEPNHYNAKFYPEANPDPLKLNQFDKNSDSDDGLNNGLNYSIIDMSLNGGLGKVISKNTHLITYDPTNEEEKKYKSSEKLTAVYNNDGTVIWFLTHFIDKFYVFKIDETGLNSTPQTYNSIFSLPTSGYTRNAIGGIKFSPNGKKLAVANMSDGTEQENWHDGNVYLFDFDNITGEVSSGLKLMDQGNTYGIEFSPNSQILYTNTLGHDTFEGGLLQFDLTAVDIPSTRYRAYGMLEPGALQLGIDGKIYRAVPIFWYLDQITNPNTFGSGVNLIWDAIDLDGFDSGRRGNIGLPSFIQSNFDQNITFEDICFGSESFINLINYTSVKSVIWDFGDPDSGSQNISTDLKPTHTFSKPGVYEITATIKQIDDSNKIIKRSLEVFQVPIAHPLEDIILCSESGSNYSNWVSSFSASHVIETVKGNQENVIVTYFDGYGRHERPIEELGTGSVHGNFLARIRIAQKNNPTCYDETFLKIIVLDGVEAKPVNDLYACDVNEDGFTEFDLTPAEEMIKGNQANTSVTFFDENGIQLQISSNNTYINETPNQQKIIARITDLTTNCYQESEFNIIISPNPIAHPLPILIGCDDNSDGISEFFDTSNIENTVLGNQNDMQVTYYDSNGNILLNNLSSPYTNTTKYNELITVRVTNPLSGCFNETLLKLTTSEQPQINSPLPLYSCNVNNGIASFDTSLIQNFIIGNQTDLNVYYYDENGVEITNFVSNSYQNNTPWTQTVDIKVVNKLNPLCFSETSIDLIVNELPLINLEKNYVLCDLTPSLYISTNPDFDSWEWMFEGNTIISNSYEVDLIHTGNYTLRVTNTVNGLICENSFTFNFERSKLPKIEDVNIQDLSDNNYIQILTSGDGNLEYSIDGINYQNENVFENLKGGVYTVYVQDKNGCGFDSKEVILIDYPKFFSPNNDNINDYWKINGIEKFPNTIVHIFNRFGQLITTLKSNDLGWDGIYKGKLLYSSDYWFTADLGDGRKFKGHFSLIRRK